MEQENEGKSKVEVECHYQDESADVREILKQSFLLFIKNEMIKIQHDKM